MKKLIFLMTTVLGVFLFISCEDKTTNPLDLDKKLSFSTLTVEQQKATIEDNGMELLDAMKGLDDTKAFTATESFINLGYGPMSVPMMKLKNDLRNNNPEIAKNLGTAMRVMAVDTNSIWGEWVYNFTTETLDKKSDLTKEVIIRFPGDSLATTNTGYLHFTYAESSVLIPETENYYPSSASLEMKVGTVTVLSAEYTGSFHTDGTPKSISESLAIDDYSWKTTLNNDQKKAVETLDIKKGTTVLVSSSGEIYGTITRAAIDKFTMEGGTLPIDKTAVYYQMMDLAILGGMNDTKGFYNEMSTLHENNQEWTKAVCDAEVAIVNKYLVCYAMFVSANTKIADIEFYTEESTDTYENWVFNYATQQWEIQYFEVTNYNSAPRLVLSDGSKVTIEEYMENGFDNMMTEYEDYFNSTVY